MHSKDGRHTIIFNGEIYNYRELRTELQSANFQFYTDSDTEVLLAAWALGCRGLRRLTGMFAFAVYDRYDESFTIVRDTFGIKPLFYTATSTSFNLPLSSRILSLHQKSLRSICNRSMNI